MGDTTDDLIELAKQVCAHGGKEINPPKREMDQLLATGEQVTIALLAMALHDLGPDTARAETGATFAEQFGTGKIGMMGTGNFNIVLARDQMKDHPFDFGISLLPGMEAGKSASFIGGDLVVIPKGSKRVDDSLAFMHYLLNDTQQVELYAKALNLPTRTDPKLTDNQYYKAEPLIADVAKALAVGRTPYSLTFFEQINDPAGPWLQQLQRAYYTTDEIDKVIADGKTAMKAISCK
jgi:multiple sugar transport system substrate-binding protein